MTDAHMSPLGQTVAPTETYTPSLLFPLPRARDGLSPREWLGEDVWHSYEFSWLGPQGKPEVAGLRFRVPCQSSHMVESKSVKLYLNSFSQTRFDHRADVQATLESDLKLAVRAPVEVVLLPMARMMDVPTQLPGHCLDELDVQIEAYHPDPSLLKQASDTVVQEVLHSHLFKSLCPVTSQPDWASVLIEYRGPAVNREGLLAYLVSYRRHTAFHEATVEQMFEDIMARLQPAELSVQALFSRRGGIDINPFRSTADGRSPLYRTPRQ